MFQQQTLLPLNHFSSLCILLNETSSSCLLPLRQIEGLGFSSFPLVDVLFQPHFHSKNHKVSVLCHTGQWRCEKGNMFHIIASGWNWGIPSAPQQINVFSREETGLVDETLRDRMKRNIETLSYLIKSRGGDCTFEDGDVYQPLDGTSGPVLEVQGLPYHAAHTNSKARFC